MEEREGEAIAEGVGEGVSFDRVEVIPSTLRLRTWSDAYIFNE